MNCIFCNAKLETDDDGDHICPNCEAVIDNQWDGVTVFSGKGDREGDDDLMCCPVCGGPSYASLSPENDWWRVECGTCSTYGPMIRMKEDVFCPACGSQAQLVFIQPYGWKEPHWFTQCETDPKNHTLPEFAQCEDDRCYDEAIAAWDNRKAGEIERIITLAAQLPSGLNDPRSADKLMAERAEMIDALAQGDAIGAALEGADAAYYAAKHLDWCARKLGLSVHTLFVLAEAKYSLRAQPGNPKDDAAERAAAIKILEE